MILVLTLIIVGVTGCYAQRYYHHHRPYGGYYYPYYYGGTRVYTTDAYGIIRRTYVEPTTVVVTRPVYTTRTTTPRVKEEKAPYFDQDGVRAERISENRVQFKGPKVKGVLNTAKRDHAIIPTKKGKVVMDTDNGTVSITVYHGDQIVHTQEL